jgi:hypothetical protein
MALPGVFPYVCVCRTACFETYKHEHLLEGGIFITVPYPIDQLFPARLMHT